MQHNRPVRSARFPLWDIGAFVLIAAFAVYHFYLAHIGFHNPDETYFLATAQRILLGDSFIVDEWQATQFSSLFQIIPFAIFHNITGGTEGVVLFFRCFFVVVHSLFGIWLYRVLRADPRSALVSLTLYLSFIPWLTFSMEHYHVAIALTVYLGIRLFWFPAKRGWQQIFCGVAFALLVLVQPLTVVLYPAYTVMVVFFNRKGGRAETGEPDCRSRRFWIRLTAGVAVTAVLFLIFMLSRVSVKELIDAIPRLFQDSEYPIDRDFFGFFLRFTNKGVPLFSYEQKHLAICALLLLPASAALLTYLHKLQYRTIVAAASALFLLFMLYLSIRRWGIDQYMLIPFVWFGLVCGLLTEKKDKKQFSFYMFGLLFAFLLNVSSECERGVGTVVPMLVCPHLCRAFANETVPAFSIRRRVGKIKTHQRRKRAAAFFEKVMNNGAKPLIAACLCAVLLTQGIFWVRESRGDYFTDATTREVQTERRPGVVYDVELRRGPYRGIATTAARAQMYEDILQDLDSIRGQMKDGDTFYIANLLIWGYLYMDVSAYTPYSPYFVAADLETRQFEYWQTHPEKMPKYIYLPNVVDPWYETDEAAMQKTLQVLQNRFICQTSEGNCGVILHVTGLR